MEVDSEVIAKIVGPIASLVVAVLIKHYTEARSKLVPYLSHAAAHTLNAEPPVTVHTRAIVVLNAGRKAAKNVRMTHGTLPENITVYPPVAHTIERLPTGGGEIVFETLVPNEQVTVSYLYFPPLLWSQVSLNTRCEDGHARLINSIPTPQPEKWIVAEVWVLIFLGATLVFYWAARLSLYWLQQH